MWLSGDALEAFVWYALFPIKDITQTLLSGLGTLLKIKQPKKKNQMQDMHPGSILLISFDV